MLQFFKGFGYAYNGLVVFFRHERNGRIQLAIAALVVIAGFWLKVTTAEWMVLLGCISLVLSFEMINSSVEKLCNLVHPGQHPAVKIIKDMAAGAVLFASFISSVIGGIIFLPKIMQCI